MKTATTLVLAVNLKRLLLSVVLPVGLAALAACDNGAAERAAEAERARAEAEAAEAQSRAEAAARLEIERLAALWTYHETPVADGRQLTAAINSVENVDTDGSGAHVVRLVFRDHPEWGRSSYLVLQAGDFDCGRRCTVNVAVDDDEPTAMDGRRPDTDEAIAMFINDAVALWNLTRGATRISVEFPVAAGGTRTASFDVGGLDASRMPGWNASEGD